MKLYRIKVLHGGPKSSHTSTETYLVAESEEAVFDWVNVNKAWERWTDDPEESMHWDEKSDKEVSFREYVVENRGDLEDDDGWEDAYYGVTKWGWEEVAASEEDIAVLLKLEIAVECQK